MRQIISSYIMGLADGPTEVHKITVAKQVLRDYRPTNDLFPAYSLISARERALEQYPEFEAMAQAEYA